MDPAAGTGRRRQAEVHRAGVYGRRPRVPAALLLGPVGALERVHPAADLAVARAAGSLGVPMVFSNQAPVPMAECAAVMGSSLVVPAVLVDVGRAGGEPGRRTEASDCDTLVVTLDTTMLDWRPRDLDHLPFARGSGIVQYTSDPVFLRLAEERAAASAAPAANDAGAAAGRDRQPRPALAAVRALVGMAPAWPGSTHPRRRPPGARRPCARWCPTCSASSTSRWA